MREYLLLLLLLVILGCQQGDVFGDKAMKLTSTVFEQGASMPSKYTCDGENVSPPLHIEGVPENTVSLALIMEDPDVPPEVREDRMWDHWVVFNMPPETIDIVEATQPQGVAGKNTRGDLGYGGPCPPDREHRYFFKVFALDIMLELQEGASKADVLAAIQGHVLDQAELMGVYDRVRGEE